ncbi:MAG: hypothetical protein PHH49_03675 [Candidatus Omnitrophica bacterium]|nr:hypothetical protein [Candidatus Omnitrophota bacterium]
MKSKVMHIVVGMCSIFLCASMAFGLDLDGGPRERKVRDRTKKKERTEKIRYVKVKGGLDTLIKVAQSNAELAKELKEETKSFERINKAIMSGELKTGEKGEDISREYGLPVIVLEGRGTGPDKWVYKPSEDDYFKGDKIYLYIDEEGLLSGWDAEKKQNEEE